MCRLSGSVVALALAACSSAEPSLQAGTLNDGRFEPFVADAPLTVGIGLQAGLWSMPSVRCLGCPEAGVLTAAVTSDQGLELGRAVVSVRLRSDVAGARVLDYVAIPMVQAPGAPAIDPFFDRPAVLSLEFTGPGMDAPARWSSRVVLARGELPPP